MDLSLVLVLAIVADFLVFKIAPPCRHTVARQQHLVAVFDKATIHPVVIEQPDLLSRIKSLEQKDQKQKQDRMRMTQNAV